MSLARRCRYKDGLRSRSGRTKFRKMREVRNTELIDEIKSHLPIPVYASRDLSNYLQRHGKYITPETELMIIEVVETGDEGGIACLLSGTNQDS